MNAAPYPGSDEQVLALATKRAVQAAGGLDVCSRETGISTSQLSRCCSPNERDSLTIRDARVIDAIGAGTEGHPFIVNALARIAGGVFVLLPEAPADGDHLLELTTELAEEFGDVAASIREALRGDRTVDQAEARRALARLDDQDRVSARLRHALNGIAERGAPNSS